MPRFFFSGIILCILSTNAIGTPTLSFSGNGTDFEISGDAMNDIKIDGKDLDTWIEEQKKQKNVITGHDASNIGTIENYGGNQINVTRRTNIENSIIIPSPDLNDQ